MPKPRYGEIRSEATCGCFTVFLITGGLVLATHVFTFGGMHVKEAGTASTACYILILIEAGIAILCWLGLMFSDPGTIQRSDSTCFPLPPEVEDRILQACPE